MTARDVRRDGLREAVTALRDELPTESEPCPEHQERPLPERDRRTT